ncbi:nucleoside diphosphate kinase regulator [Azonexus sp.]|uniref:nucleoside diphosphate kinase regulator n=1 Tax=Azonexus sp. TaxID=1872668 RepID=UPI0039E43C68
MNNSTNNSLIIGKTDYLCLMHLRPPVELADELERANIVSDDSVPDNVASMGSRVAYAEKETCVRREVEIVYPSDANPAQGKVSVFAPVGAALIGLAVGNEIDWEFPGGASRRLVVVEVVHPTISPSVLPPQH